MVQVYSLPLKRRFFATRASAAWIFSILCYAAMYIAPFFIAYSSFSFYKKFETYREQPTIHATHDFILLLEGTAQYNTQPLTLFYSNVPEVIHLVPKSIIRPTSRQLITERNFNLDSKPDMIDFTFCMPLKADESITSVSFLTFFAVNVTELVREDFSSLIFVQHDSPRPGSELRVWGDLQMKQINPLSIRAKRSIYSEPLMNRSMIISGEDITFDKFLQESYLRNESLSLTTSNKNWKTTVRGVEQDFTFGMSLRVSEQDIRYVPLPSEVIKFAYVQYFAIFYLLAWFIHKVMKFVYGQMILPSNATSDASSALRLASVVHAHNE